mmetsp:Transcript_57746/g.162882  ORF Transcript_57746/g.162882 Transcript_57746/m.162882 type:complete len:264 (-) Transcript_57746:270-1061(-)
MSASASSSPRLCAPTSPKWSTSPQRWRSQADDDFDTKGVEVLERNNSMATSTMHNVDCIYTHPGNGASIYVGDWAAACSRSALAKFHIRSIVTCLDSDESDYTVLDEFTIKVFHFPIALWRQVIGKGEHENVARFFAPLFNFVADTLDAGGNTLIHCLAGAHRAGTAGIACLMHFQGLGAQEATHEAQQARPYIDPISGLDKLLRKLEEAQRRGLLPPALDEAAEIGCHAALAELFSIRSLFRCLCCRRRRLAAQVTKVIPAY